ncbi:hypothetical protein UC34_24980 (plasmid) [Pandoraea vervacti]|jgi:hypothetical protein|uniref:Uncharacterized protein n=1 Tax=Pandoraea vervacti TaxID=656178 RepID=A0ABM5T594_9BURK|nr:hypothetical protein UC34_24980 [Pandoraea vervacti]
MAARAHSRFGAKRRPRASAQGKGEELIGRGHRRALYVFGKTHGRIGDEQARHIVIDGDALFFRQQF